MIKTIVAIFLLLLAGLAAYYYYFRYPPKVLEHKTQQALDTFSHVVESKDRPKIGEALKTLLTDAAQIHLEVRFFSMSQMHGSQAIDQDFTRPTFITFMDNILYSLDDYHYEGRLQKFDLNKDRKMATVTFDSKGWADGVSYYAGTGVVMRFSTEGTCEAEVEFDGDMPALSKASCKVTLKTLPKPGEESKLHDPAALGELLR